VILQSKKAKEEEEPRKGGKKNKKKADKTEETDPKTTGKKLVIPLSVLVEFDTVKVLPPATMEEIDQKIEEITERS
jgi:hypothetical protein